MEYLFLFLLTGDYQSTHNCDLRNSRASNVLTISLCPNMKLLTYQTYQGSEDDDIDREESPKEQRILIRRLT